MISTDSVKSVFTVISGETDTVLFLPLILGAISEVSAKLKDDASQADQRVINLCAALANLRYVQSTASRDRLLRTPAGNVAQTKNSSEKLSLALSMLKSMVGSCDDLLKDTGFFFISRKG